MSTLTHIWNSQNPSFNTIVGEIALGLGVDSFGDVFVSYFTDGEVSGGSKFGLANVVVMKLNGTTGSLIWIKQSPIFNVGSVILESILSLTVDPNNNPIVAYSADGEVSGGLQFGNKDIIVFKLNGSNGNHLWNSQIPIFNTLYDDDYLSMDTDSAGNVFVAYKTENNVSVSGGSTAGLQDIVVFKLNGSTGSFIWSKQSPIFNTATNDHAPSIAVDKDNNPVVVYFSESIVSGGSSQPGVSPIIFKLNGSNGSHIWNSQSPVFSSMNSFSLSNTSIVTDSQGNIFVAFQTGDQISGGVQTNFIDIVVIKIRGIDGGHLWNSQTPSTNLTNVAAYYSVAIDNNDNLFVAYSGASSFESALTDSEIVIFKLNGINGSPIFTYQSPLIMSGSSDFYPLIKIGSNGDVFITFTVNSGMVSGGSMSGGYDIVVSKFSDTTFVICYHEDMILETTQGLLKAKNIKVGTKFIDHLDRTVEIHKVIKNINYENMVVIKKDAFGHNQPMRDVILTPEHHILVNSQKMRVKYLVDGSRICYIPIFGNTVFQFKTNSIKDKHTFVKCHGIYTDIWGSKRGLPSLSAF